MGWVGNLLKGVGRVVGRGVEVVGDFFGFEGVSQFGRNIQNACSERISNERSYDRQSSDIYTTAAQAGDHGAF